MSPGKPLILELKGQRSRSRCTKKQVCIGLQTERNIAACCVSKQRWVFPAAMLRRTSYVSDTSFFMRHFPSANAAADAGFSVRRGFRSQLTAKIQCRHEFALL